MNFLVIQVTLILMLTKVRMLSLSSNQSRIRIYKTCRWNRRKHSFSKRRKLIRSLSSNLISKRRRRCCQSILMKHRLIMICYIKVLILSLDWISIKRRITSLRLKIGVIIHHQMVKTITHRWVKYFKWWSKWIKLYFKWRSNKQISIKASIAH